MHVETQANDFPGHNSSLFVLGVMILWFGWYGFNPGSQLNLVGLQNSFAVSNAAVTTTLAPAAAGLSALLTQALITHFTTGTPRTYIGSPPSHPAQPLGRSCSCLWLTSWESFADDDDEYPCHAISVLQMGQVWHMHGLRYLGMILRTL